MPLWCNLALVEGLEAVLIQYNTQLFSLFKTVAVLLHLSFF